VSFPIKNGGIFHSYVNVYQRVSKLDAFFFTMFIHLKILVYLSRNGINGPQNLDGSNNVPIIASIVAPMEIRGT